MSVLQRSSLKQEKKKQALFSETFSKKNDNQKRFVTKIKRKKWTVFVSKSCDVIYFKNKTTANCCRVKHRNRENPCYPVLRAHVLCWHLKDLERLLLAMQSPDVCDREPFHLSIWLGLTSFGARRRPKSQKANLDLPVWICLKCLLKHNTFMWTWFVQKQEKEVMNLFRIHQGLLAPSFAEVEFCTHLSFFPLSSNDPAQIGGTVNQEESQPSGPLVLSE